MKKGYYDLLLSLSYQIQANYLIKDLKQEVKQIEDLDQYLNQQFNQHLIKYLTNLPSIDEKLEFLNQLLKKFTAEQFSQNVLTQVQDSSKNPTFQAPIRLANNHLFTNQNEQSLIEQLNQEIITSDAVELIYPFIAQGMINKLRNAFNYAFQKQIPIRLITTTFDDQALFVNLLGLEQLIKDYSNITIRIEDNTQLRSERIHIKAAIFHRATGFSSAILGSSNLTMTGMSTGREWNIRINQFENQNLWQKIAQEYQKIWNDYLLDFNDDEVRSNLLTKIFSNQSSVSQLQEKNYLLYDFQTVILKKLAYRRKIKKHRHLIVMATGTGKTVVSAFDYLQQVQNQNGHRPKILFLAHQKEILEQGLNTFRQVLKDKNFGSIFQVGQKNFANEYLFATVQSVYRHLTKFKPDQFDLIIFDEAHHIAAQTFDRVFNYFHPTEVIGLTATPEREDNRSILPYFDDEFAHELRLWDAINQKLLAKFDYYCIDDIESNLLGVDLNNDQQVFKALNTDSRNQLLLKMIQNYIGVYHQPLILVFCINIEHAQIISNFLNEQGLKAADLTSKTNHFRAKIIADFKHHKINYLCVVNMFNEGLDVPEIEGIILLRPTNSKTIFLQQLGRGLRKTSNKNKLSVYDLIANIDQKYDLTIGIKNLFHHPANLTSKSFETGLALPDGCTINLETRSQKIILNNLKSWYQAPRRMYQVVRDYYQKYQAEGLAKIIADYDLSLPTFYQHLDNFYLKVAEQNLQNASGRQRNILKQFLFLNNYQIVDYFYWRLKNDLTKIKLNDHFDNLLIASLFPEVTSMKVYNQVFATYGDDLIGSFIQTNQLIVQELLLILEYKLNSEILLVNQSDLATYPLLMKGTTYTVKQALVAIKRLNFFRQFGALKVIAFQAGFLTFDQTKSVVLADVDATKYGKLTKYNPTSEEFYWSVPENKTINSKLIHDLQASEITKFLFLDNKVNQGYSNLSLKLYDFVGIGDYVEILNDKYLTVKFKVQKPQPRVQINHHWEFETLTQEKKLF